MRVTLCSREGARLYAAEVPRHLVLGRQDIEDGEPPPVVLQHSTKPGQLPKLIFASEKYFSVSRQQLVLEQRDEELLVKNLSATTPVDVERGTRLLSKQERVIKLPLTLTVASYSILVTIGGSDDDQSYEVLDENITPPGQPTATRRLESNLTARLGSLRSSFKGEAHEDLLTQLENIIQALQQAASSDQFLRDLVVTAAEEVELDEAVVLMLSQNRWHDSAQAGMNLIGVRDWLPALSLLSRMQETRKAVHRPNAFEVIPGNDHVVASMVAVPILNVQGQVIGALYGHRYVPSSHISRMDVRLVKLLATGAAAAIARVEQEQKLIRTKVLFEQFVTPRIAQHITANPQVLDGRDADASFLFCDIVGFSRITELLTVTQTIAWINDVLEAMSQCVLREEGTLVDYVGDELFAMFGAPLAQEDHAARACRAGLGMLAALQTLNQKWSSQLQEDMGVGIGVNSGQVLVGNIGSITKLKYGAHGTPVNIASRVQSATRYLRTQFLATAATVSRLGSAFETRRICQIRVKNIQQPISIYELPGTPSADWKELRLQYETALSAWEEGRVEKAFRILGRLAADYPHDGPTMALLKRAMEATQSGKPPEVVWELPGK